LFESDFSVVKICDFGWAALAKD